MSKFTIVLVGSLFCTACGTIFVPNLIPANQLETVNQKLDKTRPAKVKAQRKYLIEEINNSAIDSDGFVFFDDYIDGYYKENLEMLKTYGYYCKTYSTSTYRYVRISIKPQPIPNNKNVKQENCTEY